MSSLRHLLCALCVLLPTIAFAQDLEPRTYTNIPIGQNFLGAGYVYSEGDLNPASTAPIEDAELTVEGPVAGYVRSLDMWGKAGKIDTSWGRACFEGSAVFRGELVEGDRCGTTDPAVRLSYLFYGAPSLSFEEFRRTPPQRVIGASLRISAPLGDYNNENLINSGANRWSFRPEIGISNVYGRWSLEGTASTQFVTGNNHYAGHSTLEQDPLFQMQLHLIYALAKGRWVAVNGNYFWGGQSQIDGVDSDDEQENSRAGLTFSTPLSAQHSLKFFYSHGMVTRIGNDFDTLGAVWQYRWGD